MKLLSEFQKQRKKTSNKCRRQRNLQTAVFLDIDSNNFTM